MIRLPPGISTVETPLERRYAGVLKGLLTRIRKLYEEVYARCGEEGLQLIRDVSSEYGREIAARKRKHGDPWDIRQVGLYLVKVFDNMRSEGEVTEFDDRRVAIKVPECPYPFTDPQICAAHTSMEQALVKGLNPDLDYVIEKSIPQGDAYCLHVLKIKAD
jgi:predicted ArsR family transcriptional regulator